MASFMEILSENMKRFPKRAALRSFPAGRVVTYGMLDRFSGRVRAYLKRKGIGREDLVMVCLPRGARAIICAVGVWKAGAALILAEENTAPERIERIRRDSGCKLVINAEVLDEIRQTEPLAGFEKTDPHDACFAVYTSGTTGDPKGVLHEYGKLGQAAAAAAALAREVPEGGVFAMISPLNFIVTIFTVVYSFARGKRVDVLPNDLIRNPRQLNEYLIREKVTDLFMPPSFARACKIDSPYLANVFIAGEVCGGIWWEGPALINAYASSESGMYIAAFLIDRPYEVTPAGKNPIGLELMILDGDGNRLKAGEMGEICFVNEYTRGYINRPELTKRVFGGGVCHMGDLGCLDENGSLTVCGRLDDMIKINGNRIEPAETEAVLRDKLGLDHAAVRGFTDNSRAFLCAYFLKGELAEKGLLNSRGGLLYTPEEMADRLRVRLPSYMIPTYYIALDAIPVNANGKTDRKKLPAPDPDAFAEAYEAPVTENEKYLCGLFAEVLRRERVGVNDDFCLIGGNSLSSMEFIGKCRLYGISIGDLYRFRTPGKLAAYYENRFGGEGVEIGEKNRRALAHDQMLLPEMEDVVDYTFIMPSSTMWNLPFLLRLWQGTDVRRFAAAVDRVLRHHPAFSTVLFFDEDGHMRQKYAPETYESIGITELTEAAFAEEKRGLVRPFRLTGGPLHRKGLYVTEKAAYFFLDVNHLITDGTSLTMTVRQIADCYADAGTRLPEDYYYLAVREYEKAARGDEAEETAERYRALLEKLTKRGDYALLPPIDFESARWESGQFESPLSIRKTDTRRHPAAREAGGNVFFTAALLLAIARMNRTADSALQWIFNGRDTEMTANAAGLLFTCLPVFFFGDETMSAREHLRNVRAQMDHSRANCRVPVNRVVGSALDTTVFFLYQKDLLDFGRYAPIEQQEDLENPNQSADSFMEFFLLDREDDDCLRCSVRYSACHYKRETVENFFRMFEDTAEKLLSAPEDATLRQIFGET